MSDSPNKTLKKYKHSDAESRQMERWEQLGIYRFDPSRPRSETFVVDTPPPTVSGSLHIGHVFSYTHTDIIVRFQRMRGKNIMYPMGWDDNGLPTERRVQNKFAITCDPALPYDPDWKPTEAKKDQKSQAVSRRNFIEACSVVTEEDEAAFETLWRQLALSVDWKETYATIDKHCIGVSQLSFLELVKKDLVYNAESPTMWDVGFRTALAQADLEDRNLTGHYHDIRIGVEGGGEFVISTTRPELLVSCVAIAAHPSDERYKPYFGKHAITPLFHSKVPIVAAEHADPEKGTGILMICTFGDIADVDWWKSSGLPIKQSIGRDGKLLPVDFTTAPFLSEDPEKAKANYSELEGLFVKKARKKMAELLARPGTAVGGEEPALVGEPKATEHPVKFYEKGDQPIEFVTTRQWFTRILDHKQALLEQGKKITWHPSHMISRYNHWVEGLNHDWCISRQRFFGVPFPVWYPIDQSGEVDYQSPIYATAEQLPVDPLSAAPTGFDESQRNQPGGFCGDPDVMDTWATSSLSPEIVSGWGSDERRHEQLFPMDVRPQSHEIIRTWAFYTIAKAWMHFDQIPWKHVVISGWILDPDRKKMSKSKGNVVTPQHLLEQYSADAVRYWAGRARTGVDTAYDESVFKLGQKLATKLFNASKFVSNVVDEFGSRPGVEHISYPTDLAWIESMRELIEEVTTSFENFEYAVALQGIETRFWYFCDHYLEFVKGRAYEGDARESAIAALDWSLKIFLRLFAPFMPYITEEVWEARFLGESESIHRAAWPVAAEVSAVPQSDHPALLEVVQVIAETVRKAKSSQEKTLKWPVAELAITSSAESIAAVEAAKDDIIRVTRCETDALVTTVDAKFTGSDLAERELQVKLADDFQDAS